HLIFLCSPQVGQCVVVFSQAPSGRAPLSPSLNSRPSPISATPAPLGPEPPSLRSQSPVRSGAAGVVLGAVEEAPCVNGRWGTLRPRPSARGSAKEGSPSSSQQASPLQAPDSPPLAPLLNGTSPPPRSSPAQASSPPLRLHPPAPTDYGWESPSVSHHPEVATTNGLHTPPSGSPRTPPGAVSPAALRRGLEAVKNKSSNPGSSGGAGPPGTPPSSHSPPQAAAADGHAIPPIARRLGHHPPQSLNVGKPLYQSLNCKPMQMYVLDVSRAKSAAVVSWRVYGNGTPAAVTGPPETSLHTVVQGRGELIIFGGLMDKKQNVKYYPKTNALYFVRAKR
uniref:Uncharacterized protein n=1 Tax=Periophthalmus magnuspinnatus TaxID=409849 RepID=A0A3B3ZIN3_9GOBI